MAGPVEKRLRFARVEPFARVGGFLNSLSTGVVVPVIVIIIVIFDRAHGALLLQFAMALSLRQDLDDLATVKCSL